MIITNFRSTRFIKLMPLLAIFLLALLLAGCGENPTANTAPTTATPTLAATNTPSPVTTRATTTTANPTTKAAITGQATTPVTNSGDIMPAVYPDAVVLDLPLEAQKAFSDSANQLDLKDAKYQLFTVKADPANIRDYYSKSWLAQDYHTGTQVKLRSNQVVTISEFYVKDNSEVAVVATGPLDDSYIHFLTSDIPALQGKVKAGDTIFAVVSGTWVPFE